MAVLEVIGFNLQSCIDAQGAGADRIELCANAAAGGTTPGPGVIVEARKILKVPMFVMIRPRSGDFLYTDAEIESMAYDIDFCKTAGADGVVVGPLLANGTVNLSALKKLVAAAGKMEVTFHRAFDRVNNLQTALHQIAHAGCSCILTSGGYPTAVAGLQIVKDLIKNAPAHLTIMPGSGVRALNIKQFVDAGATWIHSSAKIMENSKMSFTNATMLENLQTECVDVQEIKAMKALL